MKEFDLMQQIGTISFSNFGFFWLIIDMSTYHLSNKLV